MSGHPPVPQRAPVRIQRRRSKGWTMPEGAVYVGRPTRWGNPFCVGTLNSDDYMVCADRGEAVAKYRSELTTFSDTVNFTGCTTAEIRAELRGKDLACWCPLDQPCHADVLLELANADPAVVAIGGASVTQGDHAREKSDVPPARADQGTQE